eukprot:TRINITY_DN19036_c0_g1_i1.p1 TRINITY_DN19036_c0_g1~~TRINITY_DN19036_c0_g1_i1.p1  ORF type:complete len:410 (-),score=94.66 TRINITY_DN19036_c0_g1_i1:171-1400(-)
MELQPHLLQVTVSTYEECEKPAPLHHVYVIEIEYESKKWSVKKRFSQLHAFHSALVDTYKSESVPEFPSRSPFASKLALAEERVQSLDTYFRDLTAKEAFTNSELLWSLLDIRCNVFADRALRQLRVCVIVPTAADPTELSVPWKRLHTTGIEVNFATKDGEVAPVDERQLEGSPFLAIGADNEPKQLYYEMLNDHQYQSPQSWDEIDPSVYDGMLLVGGVSPDIEPYLSNETLRDKVTEFWATERPIAAIGLGTLVLARCKKDDGQSILHSKRTTTVPSGLYSISYYLAEWFRGQRFLQLSPTCEEEVKKVVAAPDQVQLGSFAIRRGSEYNHGPSFIVQDGKYVSARWCGDAYKLGQRFCELVLAELNTSSSFSFQSSTTSAAGALDGAGESVSGLGFDAEDFENYD